MFPTARKMCATITLLFVLTVCSGLCEAERALGLDEPIKSDRFKCGGVTFRTDFGHPERMSELLSEAEETLATCISTGTIAGLLDAYENYHKKVHVEFGDSHRRDLSTNRLTNVIRTIVSNDERSHKFLDAYKHLLFARTLHSRGLHRGAVDNLRLARKSFVEVVPADSCCVLRTDLFLSKGLADLEDFPAAIKVATSVVKQARAAFGNKDEFLAEALNCLGDIQLRFGEFEAAEQSLQDGINILSDALEIAPEAYLIDCLAYAQSLLSQDKYMEADRAMTYVEPRVREFASSDLASPVLKAISIHASAEVGMGKLEAAESRLAKSVESVQNLREPGVAGRDILVVYATILDKTKREREASEIRKRLKKIELQLSEPK